MKRKRTSGGTAQKISAAKASVRIVLPTDENRLARIQPIKPVLAAGGGSFSAGAVRT